MNSENERFVKEGECENVPDERMPGRGRGANLARSTLLWLSLSVSLV